MELRHLRYFLAVADECHFGRAARRLGIRQPPLSQQIKALERELGVELFTRSSRSVSLTDAGQAFQAPARQAVDAAENAAMEAQRAGRGERGRLSIGFVGTSCHRFLPRVLREFAARYPKVDIDLHEHPTADQVAALTDRRLDVGFLRPPVAEAAQASLQVSAVQREPLVAALPAGHRLADVPVVPLQRLADDPFVLFPRIAGAGLHDHIITLCQAAGFRPQVKQRAVQMQTIVGLVAGGFGVSIVPATAQALGRSGVVFRRLDGRHAVVELAMARRTDDTRAVVSNFCRMAYDVSRAAELPGPPPRVPGGATSSHSSSPLPRR